MATTIFFNGRVIATPGSYLEVDASGLEQTGLGASGIVALLGTAEGGKPISEITEAKDLIRITSPEKARKTFRSGDLREACAMLFEPSRDSAITAGAQQVVAVKVNPATQATASLANGDGDAIDLTSIDYGAFTNQINVSISNGTNTGKLVQIAFEDILEVDDDLGGTDIFTLTYAPGSSGYGTMLASVSSTGAVSSVGTKTAAGADGSITTQIVAGNRARVVSTNAGDTTQTVTIYGLDNAGTPAPQQETFSLNGTTVVSGTATWSAIYGVEISAAHAGTVQVRDDQTALNPIVFSVASGTLLVGVTVCAACFVAGTTIEAVSSGASTGEFIVFGHNTAGATLNDSITLTGTTPVTSTASTFGRIDRLVTGNVTTGQTVTVTATAVASSATVQTTVQKLADLYNSKIVGSAGFTLELVTGVTTYPVYKLDEIDDEDVFSPAVTGFRADLYAIIDGINDRSQLVTAEKSSGAIGVPDNTSTPVFLSGGSEGSASSSDYLDGLNMLKRTRVNSIVVLTGDPDVHSDVIGHCDFMAGIGRSERDAFVGLLNDDLDDVPTKDEAKTQIVSLNSRHVRAFPQAVTRFDTAGEETEFLPPFTAAIAAGMQAGAPVGTPLTFKYVNVLGFRQDSSWNPIDDGEEMIQAGAMFLESVEGVGRRWVRNVTTYLKSNNLAFTEGSVNQAVNFATFTLRTALEAAVGRKGFSGTINAVRGEALHVLGLLLDAGILVAHRALEIVLAADVLEVSVEIAPVLPINFVKTTVHLVTIQQRAA